MENQGEESAAAVPSEEEAPLDARVYQFGLLPPRVNRDLVEDQMYLGHRYRCQLVEFERDRRDAVREILSSQSGVEEIEARIADLAARRDAARAEIASKRSRSRSRSDSAEERATVREIGRQLKALRAEAKEARSIVASDEHVGAWISAENDRAAQRQKDARVACGVYWGTYLLHESDAQRARTGKSYPKFPRWNGDGRVAVQLQGGLSPQKLDHGQDTRLQVVSSSHRTGRRLGRGSLLRMRVQSNGRDPVWAEWPMILHRPLPEGVRIKTATVSRRRRGSQVDWCATITVDEPPRPIRATATEEAVAINLGYARRPNGGIRVGYWVGSDGAGGEILCQGSAAYRPRSSEEQIRAAVTHVEESLKKADSIRSFRDRGMNEMRARLIAWIDDFVGGDPPDGVPWWIADARRHLHLWRSPNRFASLLRRWERGWWPDLDGGYAILLAWSRRDLHLERYETGMRTTARRDRREGYRLLAARLAARYRTLVVDDADFRNFQRSPEPESDYVEVDAQKWQQRVASPSELRFAFLSAFGVDRTAKEPCEDVTRRHAPCGHVVDVAGDSRELRCPHCSEVEKREVLFDQDANACDNLLRGWLRKAPEMRQARTKRPPSIRRQRMIAGAKKKREAKAAEERRREARGG